VIIFGHRGAPGYPRTAENTIGSFRKALRAGATGLEFDVRRCADGQLVVVHDDTIDRTTNGRGQVAKLTYEQLRQFDAGFGEPIPLLSNVLQQLGGKCLLNIELKSWGIAEDVKTLVLKGGLHDSVIVSSFDWDELRTLVPDVPIALLAARLRNVIAAAEEMDAAAIHPRLDLVTRSLVDHAHSANLHIHVWTVNDPQDVNTFRNLGVDGIFTDFPERCSTLAL
jgi:glycerophosphoryl diester phosphodiesterase